MTNLQKVRAAVIKAVPSIMTLEFGCEIEYKPLRELRIPDRYGKYVGEGRGKDSVNIWFDGSKTGSQKTYTVFLKGKDIEILGRPIRLADVLMAIGEEKNIYCSAWTGLFSIWSRSTGKEMVSQHVSWNLTLDDLNHQSQPTIDFLAGLLAEDK